MSERDWRTDPRCGDIIQAKRGYRRVARRIIAVSGDEVQTAGYSGNQRNRWMSKANLRNYNLVVRVEDDPYT